MIASAASLAFVHFDFNPLHCAIRTARQWRR